MLSEPEVPPSSSQNVISINLDGHHLLALIDTGAAASVITLDLCIKLRKVTTPFHGRPLSGADGNPIMPVARCTARLTFAGVCYPVDFLVLHSCCYDVIIGWDFLSANRAVINCDQPEIFLSTLPSYHAEDAAAPAPTISVLEDVVIPAETTCLVPLLLDISTSDVLLVTPDRTSLSRKGLMSPHSLCHVQDGFISFHVTNISTEPVLLPCGFVLGTYEDCPRDAVVATLTSAPENAPTSSLSEEDISALQETISPSLEDSDRSRLLDLLLSHASLFDLSKSPLGVAKSVHHSIDTGTSRPLRQRPYRVSPTERSVIEKEVQDMLSRNIIRPSSSPWASPVVLVTKKDGSIRFCVDYRRLNKVTRRDVYPMPRIDDALDCLQSASYFSSLDLRSGYWQIPMAKEDVEKTAFTTPDGLYEFLVMPFGLCNAPATFERMMDSVLRGLRWNICLCYLDDIIVYSSNLNEHLTRLSAVLQCIASAGLQLNRKKCHFGFRQIKVLGHLVSEDGILPDQGVAQLP